MPASPQIGQALYKESQKPENFNDPWLSRAMYIAALRHQEAFLGAYKADSRALPFSALPVPLRIGRATPDRRRPKSAEVAADWKGMSLPGSWEGKGRPDFDGVRWFTRNGDLPARPEPDPLAP